MNFERASHLWQLLKIRADGPTFHWIGRERFRYRNFESPCKFYTDPECQQEISLGKLPDCEVDFETGQLYTNGVTCYFRLNPPNAIDSPDDTQ